MDGREKAARTSAHLDVRVVVSVAATLFGRDCLSVVRVSHPGAGNVLVELGVRADGAVVDLEWDPGGAGSAEVLVGFGDLEQVQTATAPHCRFVLVGPPPSPATPSCCSKTTAET
jgi:hypothetical protein